MADARPLVAVLGATGATGRAAVGRLAATGDVRLRLGARSADTVAAMASGLGAEAHPVDVTAATGTGTLDTFCAGAAVVVQCAGPSLQLTPAVLAAALDAGAHLVDPAGDLDPVPTGDRSAVLGTG